MSIIEDRRRSITGRSLPHDGIAQQEQPSTPLPSTLTSRILIASLFWVLCLTLTAAGHRLYKATVKLDREVSAERYQALGAPLVWVGHGTVDDIWKRVAPGQNRETARELRTLPNSPFWLAAASGFTVLAALLAWSGRGIANGGIQSIMGLFAGHFLWLGAIEFGLDSVGRRIGLAGSLDVVGGRVVGTHGGGILIQMSVVFLIPVLIGLTMHESNRCAMFQWFRRRLPITSTAAASGRVENYSARTTMQYFMTVWFCYVSVLWLADPRVGRVGEWGLLAVMVAIFAATPYMIWRAAQQSSRAQALRYSVSGAVVTWTGIEIAAAMRFFEEPWLSHSLISGIVLLGLSLVLSVIVALVLIPSTSSGSVPLRKADTAVLLVAVTFVLTGCGQSNSTETLTAESVKQQLRVYDEQIPKPSRDAGEALLHALASADPHTSAQAAVALGKSDRVGEAVRQQLESMATNDQERLPQFAALTALARLQLLSPDLEAHLRRLREDPEWSRIATGLADRVQ